MQQEEPVSGANVPPSAAPDPAFIALLTCPACDERPPVRLLAEQNALQCDRCGRVYPIREGIPDLVVDDAVSPSASAAAAHS